MMFLTNPMVNMSLVVGDGSSQEGVQFSPPLEQTKEIMINCLKEIVENTQNFPRIEVEIFPEYKDEEMYLLDVTWEEDYVQQLGKKQNILTILRIFYSYCGETKREKFHIQSWMKLGGHFIETAENGTKSQLVTCLRLENFIKSFGSEPVSEYNWSRAFYCQTFTNFKSTFTTILKCSKADTKQFYTLTILCTPTFGQSLLEIRSVH